MAFPSSPVIGEEYDESGIRFYWDGTVWRVKGHVGPAGPTGPPGIQGIQGIQGLRGIQGLQGLLGLQGIQGVQGVQGLQGNIGTGLQGIQGIQGPVGPPGSGGNADTLDSLDSTAFLRSDVADTANGLITFANGSTHGSGSQDRLWTTADTDIDGLIPGTAVGRLSTSPTNGHYVIGIKGNDANDGFYVLDQGDVGTTGNEPYINTLIAASRAQFQYLGNSIWHAGNDGSGSGLDADLLDGENLVDGAATGSTVVGRNSSGDIFARLIRQTYTDQSTISGGMVFRINNSTDNYLRVCNNVSAIRTYLGLGTAATVNTGTSGATIPLLNAANTWSALNTFSRSDAQVMASASGSLGRPEIFQASTGGAFMAFHRSGAYASYFGLDSDNVWKVGGWSAGAVAHKIVHEGLSGEFSIAGIPTFTTGIRSRGSITDANNNLQSNFITLNPSSTSAATTDWQNVIRARGHAWNDSQKYLFELSHPFFNDELYVRRITNNSASAWRPVAHMMGTGAVSGRITWGTAAPGTLAVGEIYLRYA